jgi:hypothetical protein
MHSGTPEREVNTIARGDASSALARVAGSERLLDPGHLGDIVA